MQARYRDPGPPDDETAALDELARLARLAALAACATVVRRGLGARVAGCGGGRLRTYVESTAPPDRAEPLRPQLDRRVPLA